MQSNKDNQWYIGIDGGGSKTKAALCDGAGRVLGMAVGEASNPLSRPWPEVETTIRQLACEVLGQAGIRSGEVDAFYLGLAGADRPAIKERIQSAFGKEWGERLHVDNDAIAALYSGTWGEPGVVLIAGTGSIAYALSSNGERFRVGGWGYLLGDEGSGFDLGRQAAAAVLRAYDGRGEATALSEMFLAHYRISRPDELIASIYGGSNPRKELAKASGLVERAAAQGDPLANRLIHEAARSLVELADACRMKAGEPMPVVMAGGLLTADTMLRRQVVHLASFPLLVPQVAPVIGSLVAAMRRTGWRVDEKTKEQFMMSGTDRERGEAHA